METKRKWQSQWFIIYCWFAFAQLKLLVANGSPYLIRILCQMEQRMEYRQRGENSNQNALNKTMIIIHTLFHIAQRIIRRVTIGYWNWNEMCRYDENWGKTFVKISSIVKQASKLMTLIENDKMTGMPCSCFAHAIRQW